MGVMLKEGLTGQNALSLIRAPPSRHESVLVFEVRHHCLPHLRSSLCMLQ